jgi:NAD(P)-dependent dehydrogenase (short-subunit alcohol dehydrogenase family)
MDESVTNSPSAVSGMEGLSRNRVALVTGASSGIGAATALLFAERGYTVYGASRRGLLPGRDQGPRRNAVPPPISHAGVL